MGKKIKYEKRNIFPYGEVLIPMKLIKDRIMELPKEEERGWLTKAIIDKIKNYEKRKKEKEIELLKLDIEIKKLKSKVKSMR